MDEKKSKKELIHEIKLLRAQLLEAKKNQAHSEKAFKLSEERNVALLKAIPDLIFLIDREGTFLFYHAYEEKDLYVPPGQFIGKKMEEVLPPDLATEGMEELRKILETGEMIISDYKLDINGRDRFFERRVVPCGEGTVLSIVRDITERKEAEAKILSDNIALERAVKKRTADMEKANRALKRTAGELMKSEMQLRNLSSNLQLSSEEERKALAREVHDEVGQSLAALKIELSLLKRHMPGKLSSVESLIELVDGTIKSVKRIVKELRPELLDELGFVAAMEVYVNDFKKRSGIDCDLQVKTDDVSASPEQSIALFRILQEALTNILRHSGATKLRIKLNEKKGKLFFIIIDNGKGLSREKMESSSSTGIIGMQERALILGGDFSIKGIRGAGTALKICIPWNRKR